MPANDRNAVTLPEAAARYAAAGWPVLPLHDTTSGRCSCRAGPDCPQPGRHPRTRHGHHDATTGVPRVRAWWTRWPHANIAIPTGRVSSLVVIDLDGPDGLDGWQRLREQHPGTVEGACAVTPHGRHLWYRLPAGLVVPRRIRGLGRGIDVLGEGGYAVAAPSHADCGSPERHPAGRGGCDGSYRWTSTRLTPLPAWVPERLGPHNHVQAPSAASSVISDIDRYAQAALRGEAERVARAGVGSRNATLNLAAYHLGRLVGTGTLDRWEAERALYDAATACGLVADDGAAAVNATIASGLRGSALRSRRR